MKIKELREKRSTIHGEMGKISALIRKEDRALTEEENKKFDELDAEFKELGSRLTTLERSDEIDREMKAPAGDPDIGRGSNREDKGDLETRGGKPKATEEHRLLALDAWIRRTGSSPKDLNDEHRDACKLLNFNPEARELVLKMPHTSRFRTMRDAGWGGGHGASYAGAEQRALSSIIGSAGGFTIPQTLLNSLEVNMLAYGGMLQAASVMRTSSGEPITWPTADDTTNTGEQIGESTAVSEASPTFGGVTWGSYKFSSKKVLIPYELFEDSIFDIAAEIGRMLGERLGRIQNTKFTIGSGASTPRGIVTAATAATLSTGTATTASATAIAWREIQDLTNALDNAYLPGAAFMFHKNIYNHIRGLMDGMGRPLWADGPNSTPPATLQGYPYFVNLDMQSSVAASTTTMLFGQLSKYKIRQVNDIRLYRLDQINRTSDQDVFLAFLRADGNLLTAGTAPVLSLVQHA